MHDQNIKIGGVVGNYNEWSLWEPESFRPNSFIGKEQQKLQHGVPEPTLYGKQRTKPSKFQKDPCKRIHNNTYREKGNYKPNFI